MKALFSKIKYVFTTIIALALIAILAGNIYDFCTVNHAPLCVNHEKSYIKAVSQSNGSATYSVALCIKNIRYERIDCNRIRLIIRDNADEPEQFEVIDATPMNDDPRYISFPGLRSKLIECTFSVSDADLPLTIENINISSSSYK